MKFEHTGNVQTFVGMYEEDEDIISLARGLTKLEAECVYYHERQHQICCKSKCVCWGKTSVYLSEYHAFMGELKAVISRKSICLSRIYYREVQRAKQRYNADPKQWRHHKRALQRMMNTALYRGFECELRRKSTSK